MNGVKLRRPLNVTRDGGKTYRKEMITTFWASYFFQSEELVAHNRAVYNILMLLGSLGGLINGALLAFKVVTTYVNRQFIMGKFIRSLYFLEVPQAKKIKLFGKSMTRMS
jgi:hypothetical protein